MNINNLVTISQFSVLAQISDQSVRNYIRKGTIIPNLIGGKEFIDKKEYNWLILYNKNMKK